MNTGPVNPQTVADRFLRAFNCMTQEGHHELARSLSGLCRVTRVDQLMWDAIGFQGLAKKKQPLGYAVMKNDVARAAFLLEHCADNLFYPKETGNYREDTTIITERRLYLSNAVWYNRPEMVRLLCQHGALRIGAAKEVLPEACFYGYTEVVNTLLEYGIDVEAPDNDGRSGLTQATKRGHIHLVAALLRHGAKVDGESMWNRSALSEACMCGNVEIAELLLDHGAAVDGGYYSPLLYACGSSQPRQEAIVELLIRRGASVNKKSIQGGGTPLATARGWGNSEIIGKLVAAGGTL